MNDIDRILRRDAQVALPDEGFTARVMGALPSRAAAPRAWLQPALVLGSAALGCVLAVGLAPAGGSLVQGFGDLVQLRAFTPAAITALAVAGALLASALVIAIEAE